MNKQLVFMSAVAALSVAGMVCFFSCTGGGPARPQTKTEDGKEYVKAGAKWYPLVKETRAKIAERHPPGALLPDTLFVVANEDGTATILDNAQVSMRTQAEAEGVFGWPLRRQD